MAILDEEIRKKKAEDALIASGSKASDDSSDDEADTSTDLPEDVTDTSEEDKPDEKAPAIHAPATKAGPSYVLVPLNASKLDTKTDEQVTAQAPGFVQGSDNSILNPSVTAPAKLDTVTDEQVVAPPLDKGEAPANAGQVERATLVKPPPPDLGERGAPIPPAASVETPDLSTDLPEDVSSVVGGTAQPEVRRAALAGETPVALPPEPVVRGAQVGVTPKAQPVARGEGFYGGDLSQGPPGTKPDGTEDEPYWPKSAKDIALLPPGTNYIDPSDQSQKVTPGTPPKVQRAQPVSSAAAPGTPAPASKYGLTLDEYKAQYGDPLTGGPPTGTAAQPSVAAADAGGLNINTDYSAVKGSYTSGRGGDGQVHGIILHASDGDEKSGINTLTGHDPDHQVSAHYFVTKDGRIYNFVNDSDTAFQAGQTWGPHAQYNNASTIGIEQEHVDGKEAWAPAQVAATAKLVAYLKAKYNLSDDDIMGHSAVAPGRKIDPYNYPWKGFFKAVDSSTGAPTAAGAAQPTVASGGKAGPQAASVGPAITGKATTFGYNDPEDNGVGAPKLGQLDTNNRDLVGIAVPEEALRAYVGAHPQSWRTARVQVTGANGQQVLVPIVDLGPRDTSDQRGVVADFTQGLTDLTGNKGDQNFGFRIIPNAGPDVMKDPQAFADEQAAIKAGINTGARFQAPAAKKPSYVLQPMAPKSPQQQQAEQFAAQGQTDTLDELNRNTENPGKLWDTLNKPIQGVSDGARAAYADNFKQELTKYAQDFYGEKDPEKAFQRLVSDPNVGTFSQDVLRSAVGTVGQIDVGLNKVARAVANDNGRLDQFAQMLHPESDGPGRAAFIKTITDIKDPNQRQQVIGKLWANLDPARQSSLDINAIVDSASDVADPNFQANQNKMIADKDALIQKLFTPDPSAKGTLDTWATPTGQIFASVAMAGMPKLLQASTFGAQIFGSTQDRIREQHPDWTDEQVARSASVSTFAQLAPQEALIAASHGIMGPIARWGANPVIRFGIGGGVHLAAGAAGGALMQAGANVAEGQPIGQGVPEAAGQGAIMAAPFAVHGAVSGALTRHEGIPSPEAIPKVNQAAPLGEEPATSPPTTGPAGGMVHGATAETMASGGEESVRPTAPIAEEAAPQEPAQPSAATVDQTGQVQQPREEQFIPSNQFQPVPDWAAVPPGGEYKVNMATGVTEARWDKPPGPETVIDKRTGQSQPIPPVGESEPWVSKIANKFTAQRMAAGDLGPVEPGVGVTKEEMIARGLKMGPETINQHVSNIMNDVGGNPRDQAAAIRTEEARLSQVSRQASLASEADPGNQQLRTQADNAFKDVTDFHNGPVAKLKNNWHAQGISLQGEMPLDLSTYNGLRDAYLRDVGKPPPANAEPVLRRTAQRVRDAATAETAAMNKLGAEIEKQSSLRRVITPDQVAENIMKRMNGLPCPT